MLCDHNKFWTALRLMLQLVQNSSSSYVCLQFLLASLSHFSGFQKRRFGIFPAAVSQWLGHKTCWGSAFSHARPKHLFLEFGLVACRLPSLTLRKGLPCLRQPFFFVFSRFQMQRFGISLFNGIFPAAVSQWLGHKTCWSSAFSHARPKHLFLEFGLVACRLPSLTLRKGLPCLRQPFFLCF